MAGPKVGALGEAKNDKIDSYKIAKLIHSGMLAEAYAYPECMRAPRYLLRRRLFFVRKCAELKTHTKILNHQYNLSAIEGNLKNISTHEKLLCQFDDLSAKRSAKANIDTIAFYQNQIRSLAFSVKKNARLDDYQSFMILKSIKGVGDVPAYDHTV